MPSSPEPDLREIPPGSVVRPKAIGAHAFVILGYTPDRRHLLTAAWTTLDAECPDDECQLGPDDHPEILHVCALALSRARLWEAEKLKLAISTKLIQLKEPLGAETLNRVLLAARQSKNLRREWKTLLPVNSP